MVNNKRGWLRIMEATIAITILASVLIVIYSTNRSPEDIGDSVFVLQDGFLNEIENSQIYRGYVLENNSEDLSLLVESYFPSYLNSSIVICNMTEEVMPCKLPDELFLEIKDKNLYVSQTIIATDIEVYSPKIIKIYSWLK